MSRMLLILKSKLRKFVIYLFIYSFISFFLFFFFCFFLSIISLSVSFSLLLLCPFLSFFLSFFLLSASFYLSFVVCFFLSFFLSFFALSNAFFACFSVQVHIESNDLFEKSLSNFKYFALPAVNKSSIFKVILCILESRYLRSVSSKQSAVNLKELKTYLTPFSHILSTLSVDYMILLSFFL